MCATCGHRLIGSVYGSGGPAGHVSEDGIPVPLPPLLLLTSASANQVQNQDLFRLYFLSFASGPLYVLGQDCVIFSEEMTCSY